MTGMVSGMLVLAIFVLLIDRRVTLAEHRLLLARPEVVPSAVRN